jgi:hypothetical protein
MTATNGTTIKDFGVYNAAFADISATAGSGKMTVPFGTFPLSGISAADVITNFTPGYPFKLLKAEALVVVAATTAAKAATVTWKIGSTATTGGALSLTSANMTPKGVVVSSAITALNTGTATDTISLVGSAVTSFVEGSVAFVLEIENTATSANQTVIIAQLSALTSFFKSFGQILDTLPEGITE